MSSLTRKATKLRTRALGVFDAAIDDLERANELLGEEREVALNDWLAAQEAAKSANERSIVAFSAMADNNNYIDRLESFLGREVEPF